MGWLRLAFVMYVALTIIYFLTSIYSRSVRREKLEKGWDTDPSKEGIPPAERTAFIEAGMQAYDKGLKKRLLWLIYVVPTIGFLTTIYFINWH
ncbi:hypothetical protein [Tabrizicola piscis]|jgi:hypothetical protein|nr:hypothetical protein [Tabrizicola piscis]